MSETAWMVRSDGGSLFEKFGNGMVAIGGAELGDLYSAATRDEIRSLYRRTYPEDSPEKQTTASLACTKFERQLASAITS